MDGVTNPLLITALLAPVVAQTLKLLFYLLVERRLEWERLMETGGMPSSHSATVASLAVGVGLYEGWNSSLFAISVVLAVIVMYDATGVRRAAGMHARLLNQLVEELQVIFQKGPQPEPLKELLGHTYLEVLVGALLGALMAWISYSMLN